MKKTCNSKNKLMEIKPLTKKKQKKISSYGHPCYDPTVYVSDKK